ncbi:MAG: translation initiation factor IF-6 [Nanohaloarchaea archaeon]|nr:translation initiation factor IF-6 [Candidatus Nanohaloarchaea archaeon]
MIQKYNYKGDINTGFYLTLTNEYAVKAREFEEEDLPEKQVETRIAGTNLVGLFTAGNSNCLLVPESIKEYEEEKLEEADINYEVIDSVESALGNVVLANDKGAVISPELEHEKTKISEALDVPVITRKVAGIPNPGVCGIANSRGAVLHRDASEEDAEKIKEILQVEDIDIGTINTGSPFVGSGAVGNDSLILIGHDTTGPEIGRIDRVMEDHE